MKKVSLLLFCIPILAYAQNVPQPMDATPVAPLNMEIPKVLLNRIQPSLSDNLNTSLPISGPSIGLPPDSGNPPIQNIQMPSIQPKIQQKVIKQQVFESNITDVKKIDKLRLVCATSFKDLFQSSQVRIKDIQKIDNVAVREVSVDEIYNNTFTRMFRVDSIQKQYMVFINYSLISTQGNITPFTFACNVNEDKSGNFIIKKVDPAYRITY